MRINKQVIKDYFGSFFGQYKLNKEQFTKVRDLVDNAECGCCYITTLYWLALGDGLVADPVNQQIQFTDVDGNVLAQTSTTGESIQRICVPREATQICINIINQTNSGGQVALIGTNANNLTSDEISNVCYDLNTPVSPFFTVSLIAAP